LTPLVEARALIYKEPDAFFACATIYNLGAALLIVTRSPRARYGRGCFKVRRDDLDHFVFHLPLSGGSALPSPGWPRRLKRLDVAAVDLARPLDVILGAGAGVSLVLPRARLAPLLEDPDGLHGRHLLATTPAGAIFGRHLLTLARVAAALRVDEALAHVEATARLAATCLAARSPPAAAAPAASAPYDPAQRIRAHIEANLRDPRLNPRMLADAFHISRSQLYRLFERAGGVDRHIRDRRLNLAFELVGRRDGAPQRIGDIAFSLGFTNEAHFSHIFRERFGLSPRAARAAARRGAAESPIRAAGGGGNPLARWLHELIIA